MAEDVILEILKIAFKDRLIKSPDHPVIKKLLGQE